MKSKTAKNNHEEKQVKELAKLLTGHGVRVRCEKLTRGHSFRVKSGNCSLSGEQLVFVDQRLPAEQQLSFLVDYLYDSGVALNDDELALLPQQSRSLFSGK